MKFLKHKKSLFLLCLGLLAFGLLSCSTAGVLLKTAPSTPKGAAATPSLQGFSLSEWELARGTIKASLEKDVYGRLPTDFTTEMLRLKTLKDHSYPNAIIEERLLKTIQPVQYRDSAVPAVGDPIEVEYNAVIVRPAKAEGPVPIIMMESFCPNHDVVPIAGISPPNNQHFSCHGEGLMLRAFSYFFGRYIVTPPIDDIIARGYALAVIYPSDTYSDNSEGFSPARRYAPYEANPWGAIGAWAFMYSSLNNHLKADTDFSQTIAYGHSRYGKSALLAAAFDPLIDAVISHQSGTGGASLSRDKKGETVKEITVNYPHWFSPNYTADNENLDQHHLLALIAPRPILLGNAVRDVWSDPEGAFRAAQGANPIYKLYGKAGLGANKLTDFRPVDELSFWIRPGTHGIVKEDWPAFLQFLDSHIN